MEISPIAGIRAMPVVKSRPADPELTPLFDIEGTSRMADETWSPCATKPARGSEDTDGEDDTDDLEGGDDGETGRQPVANDRTRAISFFV
jgi:hypothetical protein